MSLVVLCTSQKLALVAARLSLPLKQRTVRPSTSPDLKFAVLIYLPDSVAVLPTTTGTARGPECFGGDCDPTNASDHSIFFTRPTPVPQLQLGALEAQHGQSAGLPSRRRNRLRTLESSGNDEAGPINEWSSASSKAMLTETGGTYRLTYP